MSANSKDAIKVIPYDPSWAKQFDIESQKIAKALGDNCIKVHHVGSTAIPGIWAKPVIDMIPVVKDIYKVASQNAAMAKLGFVAKEEYGMLFRRFFQRKSPLPACNVHVYEEGSGEVERLILLRDYLIENEELRNQYSHLKKNLSYEHNNMHDYTMAKESLIKENDERTGYKGYRIVHALTDREWEAYFSLLQAQVYDRQGMTFDKNHPDMAAAYNHHLVLYENLELIGAAFITLDANHHETLKHMAIEENHQGQIAETLFKEEIARWLKHRHL